ncbi:MAG TPA: glycosyltransferase family 4 protein [Candidatus Eisenbacteria bacterium]|nr:glycosyltransferase family 4 protein [Candidatus Eisenbacteria bacterium]
MRSIILATLDYPPQTGGIATYLENLVACFPKGSMHVLAPETKDRTTHEADMKSEIPIYRRDLLAKWIRPRWLAALYWTNWLRKKEHADLLVVSHLLPMGQIARILKKKRGLKYAVIVHGMDVALALQAGGGKRKRAKAILADAEIVVANSMYTAGLAESAGAPKEKIMVVRPSPSFPGYLTITPEHVAETRAKYGFDPTFTLLSLGRLVARKGFAEAIEAIALLKERGRTARLVIAGDGPERKKLEKLVEAKGVADRVGFVGKVPDEDVPALFGACDAFVMAPKSIGPDVEGFGIVYLEANLMGKPVIGSRAGGVPEAVKDGETGLLVNPGDPAAIADAIVRLMDDPTYASMLGQTGRRRVMQEFDWKLQCSPFVKAVLAEKN